MKLAESTREKWVKEHDRRAIHRIFEDIRREEENMGVASRKDMVSAFVSMGCLFLLFCVFFASLLIGRQ